jgi:hypothetical protein
LWRAPPDAAAIAANRAPAPARYAGVFAARLDDPVTGEARASPQPMLEAL